MEYCMTKECVEEYLDKLEESIAEYMAMPVNVRSTEAIDSMIECWGRIKSMHKMIWPGDEEEAVEMEKIACSQKKTQHHGTGP